MINIQGLSSRFTLRPIGEGDIPAVVSLCAGNPQYYRHCPPLVTEESIRHDLAALPPGMTMKDKHYLGFWEGERLIAVMDLITGFPHQGAAFIGFFMVEQTRQGQGTGRRIMEEAIEYLRARYASLHLGYAQGNEQAAHFWQKNHFTPTGAVSQTPDYKIIYMARKL